MAFLANGRLRPASDTSRVLIFFHGGGYCSGSILSHRRMVTEAGCAARMRALAIGYRLRRAEPKMVRLRRARVSRVRNLSGILCPHFKICR
jgi:hypothetical protein